MVVLGDCQYKFVSEGGFVFQMGGKWSVVNAAIAILTIGGCVIDFLVLQKTKDSH